MNRSGLIALADGTRAYFAAQGIEASVHIGIRARFQQIAEGPRGANRVVFILGDYDGGDAAKPIKAGEIAKPRHNTAGDNPHAVAQWRKPITISIWAVDPDDPESEHAQLEALETLLEQTVVAAHSAIVVTDRTTTPPTLHNAGLADLIWGEVASVAPPWEGAFGRELLVHLEQRGPLYFPVVEMAFPGPVVRRGTGP